MKIEAEQVRRGMVFQAPIGEPYTLTRLDHIDGWWRDNSGAAVSSAVASCHDLLGCDPALAARADCEQYGIAPGFDAAGFARTREGKVHDLRRSLPIGSIYTYDDEPKKERRIVRAGPAFLPSSCTFVGVRADQSLPEDVRRLCCGAKPTTWTAEMTASMQSVPRNGFGCTLAIGDHAEHEDIAAGVKWPAVVHGAITAEMVAKAAEQSRHRIEALHAWRDDMTPLCTGGRWPGAKFAAVFGDTDCTECKAHIAHWDRSLRSVQETMREKWPAKEEQRRPNPPAFTYGNGSALPYTRAEWWTNSEVWPLSKVTFSPAAGDLVVPSNGGGVRFDGNGAGLKPYDVRVTTCGKCGGPAHVVNGVRSMFAVTVDGVLVDRQVCGACTTLLAVDQQSWTIRAGWIVSRTEDAGVELRDMAEQFRGLAGSGRIAPAQPPVAPKASPTAARDAAVAKAVADVPAGCSAAGWRNVVHVLAADAYERHPTFDSWDVMQIGAAARPLCVAYERERRAGYGKEQAAKRAGADAATARLLAVYEAGR